MKRIEKGIRDPMKSRRVENINRMVIQIAKRIRKTDQCDELDAIMKGANMMAEEAQARRKELHKIDGAKNGNNHKTLPDADKERIQIVAAYLMKYMSRMITLRDLAWDAGMSESKLKRDFKNVYGITVSGFLYEARMTESRRLLIETNLSVKTIADKVGYKSESSFTVAFKRRFMVLPKEMRSQFQKNA